MTRLRRILIVLAAVAVIGLVAFWWLSRPDTARLAANDVAGRFPKLSAPRQETIPTINVAKAVGWPQGATPTPAAGLAVQAFARDLDHPRWLYRLPNGDVLVAESNSPPREGGTTTSHAMRNFAGHENSEERASALTPIGNPRNDPATSGRSRPSRST